MHIDGAHLGTAQQGRCFFESSLDPGGIVVHVHELVCCGQSVPAHRREDLWGRVGFFDHGEAHRRGREEAEVAVEVDTCAAAVK